MELRSPDAGLEGGVSTIFQELTLVPDMTVAENIVLGEGAHARRPGAQPR